MKLTQLVVLILTISLLSVTGAFAYEKTDWDSFLTNPSASDVGFDPSATDAGGKVIGQFFQNWDVKGSADFNNDGIKDMVLQDTTNNQFGLWFVSDWAEPAVGNATFCTYTNASVSAGSDEATQGELLPTNLLGGYAIIAVENLDTTARAYMTDSPSNCTSYANCTEGDEASPGFYDVPEIVFVNTGAYSATGDPSGGSFAVWYLGGRNGTEIIKTRSLRFANPLW